MGGGDALNAQYKLLVTVKVAGYSLVSYTPSLQEYGSALIYNIGKQFYHVLYIVYCILYYIKGRSCSYEPDYQSILER